MSETISLEANAAPELLSESKEGVLTLTLNRPEALNALTGTLLRDLASALNKAGRDKDVRAVVIAGNGRAFCAGADLADVTARQNEGKFEHGQELRDAFNPVISAIRRCEKPVLALVQGAAAGAGASLALACDIKICATDAKFILAFSKVGLIPDSGLSWLLPRAMGLSAALEHAWLGTPITAERALALGMINAAVPAEELTKAAGVFACKLFAVPPQALALTKRAMSRAMETGIEEQMEYEAQLQSHLGKSKDHAEGVAAFLEKRAPVFTGE